MRWPTRCSRQARLSVAIEDADAESSLESPLFGEPGYEPARRAWSHSRLRVLLES